MKVKKYFWIAAAVAVAWKLFLFVFITVHAPTAKLERDSYQYLELVPVLLSQAKFAVQTPSGGLQHEIFRTPGYPLFLAALQGGAKFSLDGVILAQVLLTLLAAWIVYKIAKQIDARIAYLSALIVLWDPVPSIISLRVMSEALFLPMIAAFYLYFIRYLNNGKLRPLLGAALMLVAATYVRPVSYYLGGAVAIFMIYANVPQNRKKCFAQAVLFLAGVYGLLGVWQLRNYLCCGETAFSSVIQHNFQHHGLLTGGQQSLSENLMLTGRNLSAFTRGFFSLLFRPISFKYFNWVPLRILGVILSYPWNVLCAVGLAAGAFKMWKNRSCQFLLWNLFYFCSVTVLNVSTMAECRMRIPVLPCVAILSASGLFFLWGLAVERSCLKKMESKFK